ncbi:cytochrome P450 [Catenulispora subtropica]|uniref:Cytochrome P450 n=1 Tax=Catenulispora subtropica TaxID=450798 RepID=A0ABN2T679_9ACTN
MGVLDDTDTAARPVPAPRRWPGPPRTATFSLLGKLFRDRLGLMSSSAQGYGDAVRVAIGPKALYFLNHPDYAKHVLADNAANYHKGIGLVQARRALGDGLLTSEGELWREQRRTIQPAFQAKRITRKASLIAEEATALADRLRAHVGRGPVDIREEMTGLTLGVLGRVLLDEDLRGFDGLGHAFEAMQDQAMFDVVTLGAVPGFLPLPKQLRFRAARRELNRVVAALLAGRSEPGPGPGSEGDDVLSRLLVSTGRAGDPRVRRTRIRDELVTLLLAGHETTASTLSWAFHLLDDHPEAWERLHAEAVAVLGDRPPEPEDLRRLKYTAMVVEETMRLYPPVWMLGRIAQGDDEVDGYRIRAGSDVVVCPYTLHRHPAFWDAPDRFDPERFDPDRVHDRPRYAYIPFGAGPRFCVGSALGTMEAVFVLATVARGLRLAKVPGYRAVPEPMLSLRVRGGLPMTVDPA